MAHKSYDNKIFYGEYSFYLSEYLCEKLCQLFGHPKSRKYDNYHCDRCFGCFEHDKETCER